MSQPSSWPLPPDGIRFFVPQFMVDRLAADPLTRDLYPLCLGYYPSAAGHHAERPEHDDHLLIYCVEGAGTLEMASRRRRIGPGDLVLLRKGTSHRYRADASDPWTLYWVHCDGERADRYLDMLDLDPETPVLSLGVLPKLIADMEALTDVRETGYNPAAFVHAATHLKQLFTWLGVLRPRVSQTRAEPLNLDAVHAWMQAHVHERVDLDAMAEAAGLSRFHFAKVYKKATGSSPLQAFIHMKVERACRLLDASELPVREIATSLGYEDPYYFSRLFRSVIGFPPTAYRALHRG
ncbi:MAG: AraC family transcriptional regulator [Gammaproteobacteria bacterium]|nr:AraC family transcriptional regulator [Gammaproteobacteria bacterium]